MTVYNLRGCGYSGSSYDTSYLLANLLNPRFCASDCCGYAFCVCYVYLEELGVFRAEFLDQGLTTFFIHVKDRNIAVAVYNLPHRSSSQAGRTVNIGLKSVYQEGWIEPTHPPETTNVLPSIFISHFFFALSTDMGGKSEEKAENWWSNPA